MRGAEGPGPSRRGSGDRKRSEFDGGLRDQCKMSNTDITEEDGSAGMRVSGV